MKLISAVLLTFFILTGCEKANVENSNPSACLLKMKDLFKEELKCTEKGVMESNLHTGTYEDKTIYFVDIMCPACNTVPPQFGYTCNGTKITITNFSTNVSNVKEVYNSCTLKSTE